MLRIIRCFSRETATRRPENRSVRGTNRRCTARKRRERSNATLPIYGIPKIGTIIAGERGREHRRRGNRGKNTAICLEFHSNSITRDGNRHQRHQNHESHAVNAASENRGERSKRNERVKLHGCAKVDDSRVNANEEPDEKEKKRETGDDEIEPALEMEKRDGETVGFDGSAVKSEKNRDVAMNEWREEKAAKRFRRSCWFFLRSTSHSALTGSAKSPRSAAETTFSRSPRSAPTARYRGYQGTLTTVR